MGKVKLPLFDLEPSPRLPLGMEELFPEGTEDTDFASFWRQKQEVTLTMRRQEVPLVNAFLTRVKMDVKERARTKVTNFSDWVQKSVMSATNISILGPWFILGLLLVHRPLGICT